MNVREHQTKRAEQMVDDLNSKILTNPGSRAALRRTLRYPPQHPQSRTAHRIVARYVPRDADSATEWAFYAIAAMMAAQPRRARENAKVSSTPPDLAVAEETSDPADRTARTEQASLGSTLARAVQQGAFKVDTAEARLHLLCRQQLSGLHRQLPRLINQLSADQLAVNWARLLDDLAAWDNHRDVIAKRWLQDYYRALDPKNIKQLQQAAANIEEKR